MSSFINKVASTITNTTGSVIGRDNITKLSNSINRGILLKSKYREFMKGGNVIQLISKSSHMTLQICQSQNDSNRLILLGNGQIGPEFQASHFLIETDPSQKHFKFRNANNYICYDNEIPCILRETNDKYNAIRSRNEFRLHEILGSDEYFALESVYFPGRYLSILPDGSITSTKNKGDQNTHFCLNLIKNNTVQMRAPIVTQPSFAPSPVVGVRESAGPLNNYNTESTNSFQSKEEEAKFDGNVPPAPKYDLPPTYTNLYPKLNFN